MSYELTDEQKNILNTVYDDNSIIKINATAGSGKAQPLYSKVLTIDGWKNMGDLKIGDKVANSQGGFSEITGIFPRGNMDIYRVYFNNGDYVECTLDHLWATKTDRERRLKQAPKVRTTKELIETLYSSNKTGTRIVKNHSIPYVKPIDFPKKELPIHPYLLGVLIGDGSLRNVIKTICTPDEAIILKCQNLLPIEDKITKVATSREGDCPVYRIQNKTRFQQSKTAKIINDMGLNCLSYNKFIPNEYLYSNVEDRLELLRGLLDTDGSSDKRSGEIEFSTTSFKLANDMKELASSLGGFVTISSCMGKYKKNSEVIETRENYRVKIYFYNDIIPFYCKRKLDIFKPTKRRYDRYISKIEKVGNTQVQCIKVSAEDSLYITDNYVLTHNTSTLIELVKEIRKNDKDCKILYTVFNRGMFEESKKKFDSLGLNVECQTTHGFALKRFSALKNGEIDVIPALDFNTFIELKNSKKYNRAWIRFKTINELLNAYCLTYDDMETFIGNLYKNNNYNIQCKISLTERDFFKDLYNYMLEDNLYTHGMYLKEYACNGKDKITSYKYILLDEAQDCNLHFYRILRRMQYNKLYAVGDTAQNIYGFTKTINIFDKLDGITMPLSKSFRINDYGCDIANRVLSYHYDNFKYGDIQNYFNRTEIEDKTKKTILFRLNATLFEYAVDLISEVDNIKVHFMDTNSGGNADGFENCFNDMLYFFYQLLKSYDVKKAEEFKLNFKFSSAKIVDNYIKICEKENKSLYRYLCLNKAILPLDYLKYFNFFLLNELDIINVVNKVKHSEDCKNPDKEYFLITAHRAKGLEWENVKIAPDDWSLKSDSECNLCYVAVTRATKHLDAKPIEVLLGAK